MNPCTPTGPLCPGLEPFTGSLANGTGRVFATIEQVVRAEDGRPTARRAAVALNLRDPIALNFCPFCGGRLLEEAPDAR